MPIKQLDLVEKIKFLVSSKTRSKKQIVAEVEEDAREHRVLNQRQEKEDEVRVDHAQQELKDENQAAGNVSRRLAQVLTISLIINFVFLVAFILIWYFLSRR